MLDLEGLNDAQREAVRCLRGPLLVLAGAGSGKTRVITYRLAALIESGVAAERCLCVTFTNKAAFEMRQRARALAGKEVRRATISTFHSFGARTLRHYAERVGLRPGFTITDAQEQIGFLRRILRDLHIDDRRFDAKQLIAVISKAKNAGVGAERFRDQGGHLLPGRDGPLSMVPEGLVDEEYALAAVEAYARYEKGLEAQNVVDFDDLLLKTTQLLEQHPDVLAELRERYHYLMVDEYQDTNGAQFGLMQQIAGERENLCVVGDDDQSIYGWRGADVSNILSFSQHYPKAKTIKLELNYRSTGSILKVANAIIQQNTKRHDKTMKAFIGPGDPVRVLSVPDDEEEAEGIASAVSELLHSNVLAKDIAVLFRSNVQSRPVELAFRRFGVPYRVVGGMELFDKREIKDALAYLRLLNNIDDEQSLRRIVNYPPRGIGDTSIKKADQWARTERLGLIDAFRAVDQVSAMTKKASDAIGAFLSLMDEHRRLLGHRKISTVAERLFEAIELEQALFASSDSATVASRRVDNVRELVKQVRRYEDRIRKADATEVADGEATEATLAGFLADLALGNRDDGKSKDDREDQVVLSTIHASKGLEWQHVYLVGAEEELLPHLRTLDGAGEIEEERRLAYVATTRARYQLTVTWARSRARYGQNVPRTRSRFFEDLPEDAVRVEDNGDVLDRTEEEQAAMAKRYIDSIKGQLGAVLG